MSEAADIWMPIYIGDLLADTGHLTPAEFGAYHFILYQQWRKGPIPDRSLRAVTRLTAEQWAESEETLKDFLVQDEHGSWYQQRCSAEKEKWDSFRRRSKENGQKGGRPLKHRNNPDPNLEITQGLSQKKPSPNPGGNPDHNLDHNLDETTSSSPSPSPVPTPSPPPSSSGKTLASTSGEVPAAGVFDLPLIGNAGNWPVPQTLYDELVGAYPGVSVMTQLALARSWLFTNPTRRKTPAGLPRFLNTWMAKAQNDAPKGASHGTYPSKIERIADNSRAALELLESMDTPAYLGGRGVEAGPAPRPLFEGAHGAALARNAG